MKTVGDIQQLVARNQQSSSGSLKGHALHVMEAREAGSTTRIGLDAVPPDIPIEQIEHPQVRKGCRCYRFNYDMGGRIGIIRFRDAYAKGFGVGVRQGKHGLELHISGSDQDAENYNPHEIYLIVGTHRCEDGTSEEALFTWHPGEPLPSLEDGIFEDTAVKIDF